MSRPSPSRCASARRARRRRILAPGCAVWLLALAVGCAGPGGPAPAGATRSSDAAHGAEAGCGPIPADDAARTAPRAEIGVAPSRSDAEPGAIVPLPAAAARAGGAPVAGEVLLALPKGPDGQVPTEFDLAPGAAVVSSFFSPVLCATLVRISGPPGVAAADLVRSAPDTAVAVPNDVYVPAQAELRPFEPPSGADPYRPLQWGLARSGAERAWSISDGRGARVALLDSAPDTAHPDLTGVRLAPLADAPAEGPGAHGTLLAGIARAVAGNDFGIAGVAPGADLVTVPVCRPGPADGDECRLFELLRGVDRAWDERVQVLNVSLVGPPNPLLRRAMDRMDELGVLVVAAVGNEGVAEPRYPAAYPSVIGVGAVDREGARYARGNTGSAVEIVAPGVEVLSTVPGGRFAFGDGTSLAAAHVTGVLALAVSASGDPRAARRAFFATAQARVASPGNEPAPLPDACEVFAALGRPCP